MKNEQPRSLTEVLEWKEKAYQKVAHLPQSEALLKDSTTRWRRSRNCDSESCRKKNRLFRQTGCRNARSNGGPSFVQFPVQPAKRRAGPNRRPGKPNLLLRSFQPFLASPGNPDSSRFTLCPRPPGCLRRWCVQISLSSAPLQ